MRHIGGVLSSWESGCAVPFPPQDSVVPVYLSNAATTQDPAGWDPHQTAIFFSFKGIYKGDTQTQNNHIYKTICIFPKIRVSTRTYLLCSYKYTKKVVWGVCRVTVHEMWNWGWTDKRTHKSVFSHILLCHQVRLILDLINTLLCV